MFLTFSKFYGSSWSVSSAKYIGVFPSTSYTLGLAPSLIKACIFLICKLIEAKWSGVAPLSSIKLISMLWMRLKKNIAAIPS